MAASDLRSCLVTGGTGFIGSHLVDLLLDRGVEVRCLVRDPLHPGWLDSSRVRIVHGDLFSEDALREGVDGVDAVFHLAGATAARRRGDYRRVNALGSLSVARAVMGSRRPPGVFVFVSSMAVAGPSIPGRPVEETDTPAPLTDYGRSKLEAERLLFAQPGLPLVVVRPPTVYGPRDRALLVFFRLARKGILPLANPGAELSFIHAEDLARGLVLAARGDRVGQVYYMAAEPPILTADLPAIIGRATGRPVRGVRVPFGVLWIAAAASEAAAALGTKAAVFNRQKSRELAAPGWRCSAQKAARELGFTASIGSEEGFAATARWYRSNRWIG